MALQTYHLVDAWEVTPGKAKTVAAADGRPMLCAHPVDKGTVGYLAGTSLRYPDDVMMAALLRALGQGPSYQVAGAGPRYSLHCGASPARWCAMSAI